MLRTIEYEALVALGEFVTLGAVFVLLALL
jgi:hypothetical protein